jgi:hypothetical protein
MTCLCLAHINDDVYRVYARSGDAGEKKEKEKEKEKEKGKEKKNCSTNEERGDIKVRLTVMTRHAKASDLLQFVWARLASGRVPGVCPVVGNTMGCFAMDEGGVRRAQHLLIDMAQETCAINLENTQAESGDTSFFVARRWIQKKLPRLWAKKQKALEKEAIQERRNNIKMRRTIDHEVFVAIKERLFEQVFLRAFKMANDPKNRLYLKDIWEMFRNDEEWTQSSAKVGRDLVYRWVGERFNVGGTGHKARYVEGIAIR